MGYNTNYSLDLHNVIGIEESIISALREKEIIRYALDENLDSYDSVKWYDHETDMREISKQFPNVIFELHGEGENNEDIWDKYFRNGKMQACYAKIVIPPFDESKLE